MIFRLDLIVWKTEPTVSRAKTIVFGPEQTVSVRETMISRLDLIVWKTETVDSRQS